VAGVTSRHHTPGENESDSGSAHPGSPRPCANPSCGALVPLGRSSRAVYCSPACSARARSARYRASARGRQSAATYRRSRQVQERERARLRRATWSLAREQGRLESVRDSVRAELPVTAGQISAVQTRMSELSERVESLAAERDSALADARQLARLARHLFLSTGAAGFGSTGVQELLDAHLLPVDRRQVPAPYEDFQRALAERDSGTSSRAGA
jgi:hypothetical protein